MKKIFSFSLILLVVFVSNFASPVYIQAEEAVLSSIAITTPAPAATLTVRDGDTIIFSGSITIPTTSTLDLIDNTGTTRSINAQSVLSMLHEADVVSSAFRISNLQYFDPFDPATDPMGSLYLKCVTVTDSERCDNWQYVVNSSYPFVGMDKNTVSGNEIIYLYFGLQNKVVLGSTSITTSDTLTVTAQKYDYENDAWLTRTGVTVGLTQFNPETPWSPTEVQTGLTDENGQAVFSSIPTGSYNVGVKEDFYFPTETLTVTTPASSGGGGSVTPSAFSATNALAYLKSVQKENGSFEDSFLYTDWAGIAFGAINEMGASRDLLLSYLTSNKTISSLLTDNERRAITLLALGQNPYLFNGVNYIDNIISSFDGTQFGDQGLVNDDIFALIPLKNSGFNENDKMISETITFVISKQDTDGSWEGSVDITAAAIQALKPFESIFGTSNAINKAGAYLKTTQNCSDGGWGNVFSTSWAMQAESTLGALFNINTPNCKTGLDYLSTQQAVDGAVSSSSEILTNRIWATSYAIAAASGKTWSEIMQSVTKPETQGSSNNSSTSISISENTNPQILTKSIVICPAGHLFSITTGETCTETAPMDFEIPPTENIEKITLPIPEKITALSVNLNVGEEEENTLEINPSDLSASVINSVSPNNETSIFSRSWKAISIAFSICARLIVKILGF